MGCTLYGIPIVILYPFQLWLWICIVGLNMIFFSSAHWLQHRGTCTFPGEKVTSPGEDFVGHTHPLPNIYPSPIPLYSMYKVWLKLTYHPTSAPKALNQSANPLLFTRVIGLIRIKLRTLDDLEKRSSLALDGVVCGWEAKNRCSPLNSKASSCPTDGRADRKPEKWSQNPGWLCLKAALSLWTFSSCESLFVLANFPPIT